MTYNLRYRESVLLERNSQVKIDLVRTSLLAIHLDGRQNDMQNLKSLLDNSLPPYAGLDVVIFSQDEAANDEDTLKLFSDLVNSKKVHKIVQCSIPIPELTHEALQVTPRLTRKQFSQLLEKYIAMDMNKALATASLIHKKATFKFKKVKLDELVQKLLESYW